MWSSTGARPRGVPRDTIGMGVSWPFPLYTVLLVDDVSSEGCVLGVSAGLRVVQSKERSQRGLELAPRGRPYVRTIIGNCRCTLLNSIRYLATPHDPSKQRPIAISVGFWSGPIRMIPSSTPRPASSPSTPDPEDQQTGKTYRHIAMSAGPHRETRTMTTRLPWVDSPL